MPFQVLHFGHTPFAFIYIFSIDTTKTKGALTETSRSLLFYYGWERLSVALFKTIFTSRLAGGTRYSLQHNRDTCSRKHNSDACSLCSLSQTQPGMEAFFFIRTIKTYSPTLHYRTKPPFPPHSALAAKSTPQQGFFKRQVSPCRPPQQGIPTFLWPCTPSAWRQTIMYP